MAKVLDTTEYIDSLMELVTQGLEVPLLVSGGSMLPFLAGSRDSVLIALPKQAPRVGDIVLFRRSSGQYILHRVQRRSGNEYYFIGDAQTVIEGPISEKQICAVVTAAVRKGCNISPGSLLWWFFAKVWIRIIPLRKWLEKAYNKLKKHG